MGPAGGGPPSSCPPSPVSSTKQQQHCVRSDLAAPRPATNWEGPPHPQLPTPVARTSQRLCQFRGSNMWDQYVNLAEAFLFPGPAMCWGGGQRSRSHSPVETRDGADRRTTKSRHYRQETGGRRLPLHAASSAMEPTTDSRE